jgi:hypothetical protein
VVSCTPVGLNDRTVAPDGSGEMTGFAIAGLAGVIFVGADCDATRTVPAASSAGATDVRGVSVPRVFGGAGSGLSGM